MARTTEAFAVYHRQKETLAEYVPVATAALGLLERNLSVPDAPAMLGAMVDACGVPHWGRGKRYTNPSAKIATAKAFLANHAVVQHVAAFDNFSRNLALDALRFSASVRENPRVQHDHSLLMLSPQRRWVANHCCNDVAGKLGDMRDRLEELGDFLGWKVGPKLVPVIPLFHLARRLRNRIVHSDGMVGSDLEEFSSRDDVAAATSAFQAGFTRGKVPKLPEFRRGMPINLDPVHAIFFGAVLYEFAKELNGHVVSRMADDEFIDMAFFYAVIPDDHPFRLRNHRFAENRIGRFLSERYLRERKGPKPLAVIQRLSSSVVEDPDNPQSRTNLWRVALERHKAMQEANRTPAR